MARMRSHWQSIASQAEAEGWTYSQFLYALCEQEVDHRQITRRQRLLREAHLPWQKGLEGFDHLQIDPKHWRELRVLLLQKIISSYELPAMIQKLERYGMLILDDNHCAEARATAT